MEYIKNIRYFAKFFDKLYLETEQISKKIFLVKALKIEHDMVG